MRKKLLLIEDDAGIAALLPAVLRPLGYDDGGARKRGQNGRQKRGQQVVTRWTNTGYSDYRIWF